MLHSANPGTRPFALPVRSLSARIAVPIAGSALLAVCAHVAVPLPFTPVPVTMQTFAVMVLGLILGPIPGATAALLYLLEGLCGLPVFAPQGPGGALQLLGPTGGFLLSYPLAALLIGTLNQRLSKALRPFFAATLSGMTGLFCIFVLGTSWIIAFLHLAPMNALRASVLPFLPGELLKLIAAGAFYTSLRNTHRS